MRLSTAQGAWRVLPALALLCLVLSSCSSEDVPVAVPTSGQLTFNVQAEDYATRGTPLNSVSGTVGVMGFEFDESWDDVNKSFLMYNEVVQGSGETWKSSKSFLPDASLKKRFYAYFPYQTNVDADGGMIQFYAGNGAANAVIPYFSYKSPEKAADQKDLMYAISSDVSVNDETGQLDPVELKFHHLLAALKLTVTNGFDNGTITKVSLSKIHDQAAFMYETEKWENLEQDVITISQDVEVKVNTKNNDVLPLTSETQYFMLLPQTLEQNSVLTIVFNNGDQDFNLTCDLGKLRVERDVYDEDTGNTVRQLAPLTFEAGKVTTLNIDVESVTKMAVKCTLTDWNKGATFDGADSDQVHIVLDHPEGAVDDWEGYKGSDPATGASTETTIITGPQS